MLRSLLDKAGAFRQRLTRLDDQPMGKAALVVIVFLDLFILGALFDGLADHTRQLASPEERVPALCRDLVIEGEWNPSNRLDRLAVLVSRHLASEFTPDERPDAVRQHALCAPIVTAFEAVRDDAVLARSLREFDGMQRQARDLRAEMERVKGAYDTRLLERISGQARPEVDTAAISGEAAGKTAALEDLVRRQAALRSSLEEAPRVRALFARVAGVTEPERTALRDELRRMNFWYPAQRLGMEMLFLLPPLLAFYLWNSRSIARRRPFQTLVSSHLLVVVVIPVFLKVAELVYDIIPRRFLRQFIELLESLKLVALWHYLVIGVSVVAALALIYLFQKKLFSRERLLQRRIARGHCQECGLGLPPGSRHCPACGAVQVRECDQCKAPTPVHGRFCTACGHETPPS